MLLLDNHLRLHEDIKDTDIHRRLDSVVKASALLECIVDSYWKYKQILDQLRMAAAAAGTTQLNSGGEGSRRIRRGEQPKDLYDLMVGISFYTDLLGQLVQDSS